MVTARFVGGPDDGTEVRTDNPDNPPLSLCVAQPTPLIGVAEWADQLDGPPTTAPAIPAALYRYHGNIADDGARLYHYAGTA